MTTRKPSRITYVPYATCCKCGGQVRLLVCLPDGQIYCLPCLREHLAHLYSRLVTWIHDYPPKG